MKATFPHNRLGIWQKAQWKATQVLLMRTFPISETPPPDGNPSTWSLQNKC